MKRKIFAITMATVLVLLLTGCGCEHRWQEASCEQPQICTLCGEMQGMPLGHSWKAATCTEPKICENCAKTEGTATGHTWEDATCLVPKKCASCHETEGQARGHDWQEATTEAPKTCANCQSTEGNRLITDPRFTTASTKELHGKWVCEITLTGEMVGTPGYFEGLPCKLYFEFGKTGEVKSTVEIQDMFTYMEESKRFSKDLILEALAQEGISEELVDKVWQEEYGMTLDEYIDFVVAEADIDELFEMMENEGCYYVTEGKLHLSESWHDTFESNSYRVEDDVLIFEFTEEDDELPEYAEKFTEWKKVE